MTGEVPEIMNLGMVKNTILWRRGTQLDRCELWEQTFKGVKWGRRTNFFKYRCPSIL